MPESLRVKLNDGAVHAVDAPEEFTAHGPFHVELRNLGGPVHVHLRLADGLSRVARIDRVNHYVGEERRKSVPVGVVPDRGPVGGRIEIVSGYGAETAAVDVTIVPDSDADPIDAGGGQSPDFADNAPHGETGEGPEEVQPGEVSEPPGRAGGPADRTGTAVRRKTDRSPRASRARSGTGSRGRSDRALTAAGSRAASLLESASRDELAFLGLAVVALVVGLAVILAVGEILLGLVVAGVVAAVVATAGWLLLA